MLTASYEHARQYLARVLPWGQDGDEPSYINIHSTFASPLFKEGKVLKPPWRGRACRTVSEAINAIDYSLNHPDTLDIYACMSSQREADERQSKIGKGTWLAAIRNQANAVALKALFLDIDLKGGDHGYISDDEVFTSLGNFLVATGLPKPSLAVYSGGGYHIYWILDRALSPYEWEPLAYALAEATKKHGLKCDTQCTIDSARVLRIPETLNRKTTPPRPVRLVMSGDDYSVERLTRSLTPYMTPSTKLALPLRNITLELKHVNDELSAGIDQSRSSPIDLKTVIPECGFLRDALTTGGAVLTNPLWNLTTLLSTFCEDARPVAHLLGRKHPGYTQESTDELFDRKEREKESKGLGWPLCKTISGSGATQCQVCPHFGKGKSPLHFAQRQALTIVPAPITVVSPPLPPIVIDDLPKGYVRNLDNVVCRQEQDDDGITQLVPLCNYPMITPWLQKNPWVLNFSTFIEHDTQISIEAESIGSQDMRKVLQRQGLMLHSDAIKGVGEFLVSWVEKLKATKNAIVNTESFGWNIKRGVVEGFAFGGSLWTTTDPRSVPIPDPVTVGHYAPTGDIVPWLDAAKLITNQRRPQLNAIVAAAFGAPLARFTGQPGLLLSTYSEESGIGKSTAMKVAQSVWGDPVRGMQGLSDTQNSVLHKIGILRSLPLYWDELKTEDDTKKFVNLVFQLSLGKEKTRLNSRIEQRQVGAWQTILVSASNESLLDYVISRTRMTTAGLYRVFEYEVTPGVTGQIAQSAAARTIARLNDNHGMVGLQYAKFLGKEFATIDQDVGDFLKDLEMALLAQPDERFWTSLVTCLCVGARYSNRLGFTEIDEEELKAFLIKTLKDMRGHRNDQPIDMKKTINVTNILASFLNAMRDRHTLLTNRIHITPGKPAPGVIKIMGAEDRLDGAYVHVGVEDKILRISSLYLSEWLNAKGYSRHLFTKALEFELGMKPVRGRIGSGTHRAGMTEYLLEIDLAGTPLANFLDEA